ncbi:MAG: ArsJ-associated glyceraldehyde-3-phosphate dehydrogenase [Methylococcales bacterium]|jgi:glyceraldehyde 3-phosphate dehydrogenase|nr:ArsJ-associated glyceraldehyde-3-phosphate dehydrogenase [Methylococcales bacterium]MBT7442619.1 ArsJ-associated glyceraldehyde-3-phosphate dehydrogenase [Methylococcales bacterium]
MKKRIAINGFGRMGRLALRAAWDWPEYDIVHINEVAGDVETAAHLLKYDSVNGTWDKSISTVDGTLLINQQAVSYSQNKAIDDTDWQALNLDAVVECTGQHKTEDSLAPYFKNGIKKIIVSAPVAKGALSIVMGVNDHLYQPKQHHIVTAASCTTNCLAPIVEAMQTAFTIKHIAFTTIHNITNTQSILDEYHSDLRRTRASGFSLIPTTTGSAKAIIEIFPELKGKINGTAVRVPLANASLTDCVFELEQKVTTETVNTALKSASENQLKGILGYETAPLVSCDFNNDQRSSIIDSLSTMVINDTQVKIMSWYDNEVGYVNRMMELVKKVCSNP